MQNEADTREWVQCVRRAADHLKTAITSNGRLPDTDLAALASDAESLFKRCRKLVEE